jgi:hypothetical protein
MSLRPSARRGPTPPVCGIRPGSSLFLLALVCLAIAPPGFSQDAHAARPRQALEAERLTQSLVAQQARYHGADAGVLPQAVGDLLEVAAKRHDVLAALIEKHPGEVLRLALPEAERTGMPAEVQELLEQRLELEGELEVLHVDYEDPAQSHYLYLLTTELGERYSLHFIRRGS